MLRSHVDWHLGTKATVYSAATSHEDWRHDLNTMGPEKTQMETSELVPGATNATERRKTEKANSNVVLLLLGNESQGVIERRHTNPASQDTNTGSSGYLNLFPETQDTPPESHFEV